MGMSQLMGYPGQFPSVSLVDWTTGKPNARIHILNLLNKVGHVIVVEVT